MTSESVTRYLDAFAQRESRFAGADLPWLRKIRREGMTRFAGLGFPTPAQEDWKYTNTSAIEKRTFNIVEAQDVSRDVAEPFFVPGAYVLAFVNGRYAPSLSRTSGLPPGAVVRNLASALERDSEQLFKALATSPENGFSALNAAFWTDGAYIALAPGVIVEQVIQLLFLTSEPDQVVQPRNLILAAAGAQATVIEHYVGPDEIYFTNAVTQIQAEQGAHVAHHKLQQEGLGAFHIASISCEQDAGSRFHSQSFALGARLSRNDIRTRLNAEACETGLYGLYLAGGRQHMDHHTRIDHLKPHGTSRQVYKGVLDGAARAVFNGKVIVHPDAQKSDAYQSNRNLLLSDLAEIDTKPQLEIYADDVKCAHGATVGNLDENQIFYLRSRGVDEASCRSLLTYAFAAECIAGVSVKSLRQRLEDLLIVRLPGGRLLRESSWTIKSENFLH